MEKLNDRHEPSSSDLHSMRSFSLNFLRINITESLLTEPLWDYVSETDCDVLKNVKVFFKKERQDSRYHNCIGKSDVFLNASTSRLMGTRSWLCNWSNSSWLGFCWSSFNIQPLINNVRHSSVPVFGSRPIK
jgi:hypothetical protein